jgi:hypothetical protein
LETSLVDGALKLFDRLAADRDSSPALYFEATCVYGRMLLVRMRPTQTGPKAFASYVFVYTLL